MPPRRNHKSPSKKGDKQEETEPVVMETEKKAESKAEPIKTNQPESVPSSCGLKFSMLSWFLVLAVLGVWSSVAVVYFDIIDYENVVAKLRSFDVGDAEVLLDEETVTEQNVRKLRKEERRGLKNRAKVKEENAVKFSEEEEVEFPEGLKEAPPLVTDPPEEEPGEEEPERNPSAVRAPDAEDEIRAAVPLNEDDFIPDDPGDGQCSHDATIDATGVLVEPPPSALTDSGSLTSSKVTQEGDSQSEAQKGSVGGAKEESVGGAKEESVEGAKEDLVGGAKEESVGGAKEESPDIPVEEKQKVKKKKPKLLNKLDQKIKAEIDSADKLRKKGKVEEALRAFESLIQQNPQSPRARYGKAQCEDDLAEKLRSNDLLQKAISSYGEVSDLPDVTSDLLRATLKRRAERQQFLGRMAGSLRSLKKLLSVFPDDVALKNELGVAHLLVNDNQGAKKLYEEVLAAEPDNGFAKVHYGFILKSENLIAESIPFLQEGLESGHPGTDDGRFYFQLGDALQRVGDDSAYVWYERGFKRGHFASVWQRSLYNVKGLKAQPWWTPSQTGYTDLVKMLERNWKTFRDEALAVMDRKTGLFLPEEENLREKGEWTQYTLWQQGRRNSVSCQSAPKSCSLLERHPEATGCKRGQIKFSVMKPGTHVWPHTGPTNCRLRIHLGLVVPERGCRIRCTNSTREWEEGKVLIFDDSFEHEVWQDANSLRLIFIVDVWHPELTQKQRLTLSPI